MRTWIISTLTALVAASTAAALEVPLTVAEPAGVARTAEPVSGGIPLPWGQFKQDQAFSLTDAAGKEVPCQALPLVVDEKGFLRWVLLDFQTDLAVKEKKTFTLKTAAGSARPAKAVKVTRDAKSVTVDTGAVSFTIDAAKPFSLLSAASAGGKAVVSGGEASYTDGFDGKRYVADKPTSIDVEYEGPLRATVCVKGRFVGDEKSKFGYVARITAWAGRSDLFVKYSLANSNPDHYAYRRVKDSTVALTLADRPREATLGASKALKTSADAWMQQSMRVTSASIHSHDMMGLNPWFRTTPGADGPGGCKAVSAGKDLWTSQGKGDVAEGWIAVTSGGANVSVCDLYFVEDPPRRLAATDGALVLTGITEPLEGAKPPWGEPTRWLFDCTHITSQYLIDLAAPADPAAVSANVKRGKGRLWAMAPPAWYFDTEGLSVGRFGTQADELACYDAWGWKYDKARAPQRADGQTGRIGRYVAGDDNHFVSEQDTLDGLLLMYLRTGSRAFFDAAQTWANYFLDLQTWRTDGWRWKDGGVWWHGGPAGNRAQRAADPVTGLRTGLPAEWTKSIKTKLGTWDRTACRTLNAQFLMKACHCHNWGEGLVDWFLLTGDRDACEAAIDTVEQQIDFHRRASGRAPGKARGYSRDFTRACHLTNAARLAMPTDPFVVEASDYLAACYLKRPNPEPRGFVNAAGGLRVPRARRPKDVDPKNWDQQAQDKKAFEKWLKGYVGDRGVAAMKERGVTFDAKTGRFTDPKTGAAWRPLAGATTWMYPPLSRAMETYLRITGDEDAQDWLIAYGQAVARVLYQPRHGRLHSRILVDFPVKGVAKDLGSWLLPENGTDAKGVRLSHYLGGFHPDIPARAYALCGEPTLKQRAYDYWFYVNHAPGAGDTSTGGAVSRWVNLYSTHDEAVCFTGKTFYIWSHPRDDEKAPAAVTDLSVSVSGEKATVSFTAPADQGGKVVRYQVKCSDKPIVDYTTFLKKWAANEDAGVTNWWLAANLAGEPTPGAAGRKVTFTVIGVPDGARHFAVRSFDDSSNRSALSNAAMVE